MKTVVVASTNPVKVATADLAFASMFPEETFSFMSVKAVSGVSDQPFSDAETLMGAVQRIASAQALAPGADFYIAMEGGAEDRDGVLYSFSWIVVESNGRQGKGRSAAYPEPAEIRRLMLEEGKELGDAVDIVFNDSNSKQKSGAIGHLTRGVLDRTEMYRHAAIFALLPFARPDLY